MLRRTMSLRRLVDTGYARHSWRCVWKGFSQTTMSSVSSSNHSPRAYQETHLSVTGVNNVSGDISTIPSPCAFIRQLSAPLGSVHKSCTNP